MKKYLVRALLCSALLVTVLTFRGATAETPKNAFKEEEKKDLDYKGSITAVDATAGTVTISHKEKGPLTLTVAKDCLLFVKHKKGQASLADFKVGEEVKVLYRQDAGALVCHSMWQPGSHPSEKEHMIEKQTPKP
jgi:Cu/Ag efflux protein CusF